jgi:hypothetical protein
MTTKPGRKAQPADGFVDRPRRLNMQNIRFLHRPGHITALARHFGRPDTTLVFGEMPVDWRPRQQDGQLYPDLLVAFDVDAQFAISERGFAVEIMGKPPDFVLEVASGRTAENDYTRKRRGYAEYGVPEYWRFDNTGGDFYPEPLAGDRLVGGEYQPMTVVKADDDHYWGHSEVLDLDLCWEFGQLRWYDPAARRYLRTHEDEAEERIAESRARQSAEAQLDAEQQARFAAEARVRQLEEELRRRSL